MDSMILKVLKFLTKLLGKAIPYSAAIRPLCILFAVCIETNGLTGLRTPNTRRYLLIGYQIR